MSNPKNKENSRPTKLPHRYIEEGKGGTFTIDTQSTKEEEHLALFGTFDCITCVGVYLPIDAQRCFVAHISAYLGAGVEVDPTDQRAENIEDFVHKQLDSHSKANNWGASTVAAYVLSSGKKPLIVCPSMDKGATGYHVVIAIERFFAKTGLDLKPYKYPRQQGFVVDHNTGVSKIWEFGPDRGEREWERYEGAYKRVIATDGDERVWEIDARFS